MPSSKFSNPIDMEFAPSGDLYVLEYGTGWFQGNADARLVRIEYNAGNRAPVVVAGVDKPAGALPLARRALVDGHRGRRWRLAALRVDDHRRGRRGGAAARRARTRRSPSRSRACTPRRSPSPTPRARARRRRRGSSPATSRRRWRSTSSGNRSFYFPGTPIRYAARVTDREDGSLESGSIAGDAGRRDGGVPEGRPARGGSRAGHRAAPTTHARGREALIEAGTCLSCHQVDRKSIGPTYNEVAAKYQGDANALARLATKIRAGGSGVWGQVMMPPHPQLTEAQTTQMAAYILSLGEEERAVAAGARRVHAARGHGAIQLADRRRGAAPRAVHRQGGERAPRRGGRQDASCCARRWSSSRAASSARACRRCRCRRCPFR